jgi:hypothetical protein
MHATNMELTDGVHGENRRIKTDRVAGGPSMMDKARMWPGVGWPEEL